MNTKDNTTGTTSSVESAAAATCPSCAYSTPDGAPFEICPRCGLVIAKFLRRKSSGLDDRPLPHPAHAQGAWFSNRLLVVALIAAVLLIWAVSSRIPASTLPAASTSATSQNATKLFLAVRRKDVEEVSRLLLLKNNPNCIVDGKTPLELAAADESTEIISLLVENGASVSFNRKPGELSLIDACVRSELTHSVACLLELGIQVEDRTQKGNCPLIEAVKTRNLEMVRLLVEHGKSVNSRDSYGDTPLIVAARSHNGALVRYLVKNGADVNARDSKFGMSVLMWGVKNTEVVKILIEAGADINARDARNSTPLHSAVGSLNLEVVKLLIEKGADVSAKDNSGVTPLKITTFHRNPLPDPFPEMADLLRKAGAVE